MKAPINCMIEEDLKTEVLCLLPLNKDMNMTTLIEQLLSEWVKKEKKNPKR